MRRALLVLMVVSFIGITSAMASSFTANSEDMLSFSTSTSLAVPCTPEVLPVRLWVRGPPNANGTLDLAAPGGFDDPAPEGEIERDEERVEDQRRAAAYLMWRSPPAPNDPVTRRCGYLLQGRVRVFIDQDGDDDDLMSAGLFTCPPSAPAHSDPEVTDCDVIDEAVGGRGAEGTFDNGPFQKREVDFGNFNQVIPAGQELRLKIVNRRGFGILGLFNLSDEDWNLRWGYRGDRKAQLTIGVPEQP